jgi:penicillin-binding protein 1C
MGFEAGLLHPETMMVDRPRDFGGWRPENIDGGHRGLVTAREALQASLNVPAVAVLEALGPVALTARLRRAGAAPLLPEGAAPGLPMALGGLGLTLEDLVMVYAALASPRQRRTLHMQPESGKAAPPVLSVQAAWQVADVLAGAAPPPGAPALPLAWKTGTSYGHRDAWALGFDGHHVVGVWLGRADGGAVPGLTGRDAAAPLLFATMAQLPGGLHPLPPRPDNLPALRLSELVPGLRYFGGDPALALDAPRIAYPPDGAQLPLSAGEALTIRVEGGRAPLTWLIEGRPAGTTPFARETRWQPQGPGFVSIVVVDAAGISARSSVRIRSR